MNQTLYLSGIGGGAKAHYLFNYILRDFGLSDIRVFAFVKNESLQDFHDDLHVFFDESNAQIPIILFPNDDISARISAIDKIKNLKNFILCASDESFNSPVPNPNSNIGLLIESGKNYKFENILSAFSEFGYSRVSFVEDKQQFAVRGDIIDIWNADSESPVRILFEFDCVESIRYFEPSTQLSNDYIDEIKILPIDLKNHTSTIKEYFSFGGFQKTNLFFDYKLPQELEKELSKYNLIINDPLNAKAIYQGYKNFTGFAGDVKFFMTSLEGFASSGADIKIFCANDGERERISDILNERKWKFNKPDFVLENLSKGFYFESEKTVFVSSREMLYKRKPVHFPKIKGGKRIENIWEISAGDYVVHEKYGIGRYAGLKTISRGNKMSEYLCIEYAKGDKLYVPPDGIKKVKKYIGVEGARPKLYSMDSAAWERVKSRAREEAARFAKELLELYTQRSLVKRSSLSVQTAWEKELADAFPYDETPDQLKAIEDIEADFAKPYPMERLICGDVGYGKTEVAVRAAFKVIQDGKQVAVLAPTTVLAQQHYNTFSDRLSIFPTKVEMLSRFQNKSVQHKIVESLNAGSADIVIGTHRLLQKDVKFANLGLLIIDEEHRFGVKQKEHIKEMKKNIDILMLSATPIPRTLSAALSGFRDLSIIETPPFGRLPIETSLSVYNEEIIKKIIEAELSRNGQVFYVYNDVVRMQVKSSALKKLVPDARLAVLHGQMHSKDIESVMWKFTHGEFDILLASTIIESGLDIPTVNTMIIEDAQNFGLSQLYQLRGRVGREKKKAYCYLFYKDEGLSEEAIQRLEAMKEFSELGSGFRLAMKDLEIRGAGGILSKNQHGFVRDIGYDMFSKLLEEEGEKVKGLTPHEKEEKTCEINLNVSALIPNNYIEDEDMRIMFYRKLADAKSPDETQKVKNEITDRFGKVPQETQKLFEVVNLRISAEKLSLESISEDNSYWYFYFYKNTDFSNADIPRLVKDFDKKIEFISGENNGFKLKKENANEND
ncbi:MAG: transcription-repair coupling factor, partial [Elusimicrobiota bacterium]|nr:transcription-repair coupling factor [Elusimicrobiota bacterium]